ncbi:hypothetical protein ACFV0H_12075 [Streptomyces erythrochromogenes]|uniref:hypothetical protein n=1 Tax=Streptomyces erythrochromogenes TaxID=285574 RepID=UPI00368D589A
MTAPPAEDRRAVARRLHTVPAALAGYRAPLHPGARTGLPAAPRHVAGTAARIATAAVAELPD